MVDFKTQRAEIKRIKAELERTDLSYHRRHDLRKHLGRLHKEMSEAKKWQRGEMYANVVRGSNAE